MRINLRVSIFKEEGKEKVRAVEIIEIRQRRMIKRGRAKGIHDIYGRRAM